MKIAIGPNPLPPFVEAIERGGGTFTASAGDADGLIWVDPHEPSRLAAVLETSNPRWVQLPFAGIERFFAAGVMTPGRTWTCAKGIYGHATAEQALALMLAGARRLHEAARRTTWLPGADAWRHRRLAHTTALIIGTGGIGEALAAMLSPLKVRIVASNRSGKPVSWAERVGALDDLIPEADWVVVAAAHTPETTGMIGAAQLALMKPDAWLINVARGPMVNTEALVEALKDARIGGAALDVTDPEPLPDGHPLWTLDNALVTSHTANTQLMALPELAALIERNVGHFVAGEPLEGPVDLSLGY